jgi:hypothetical protein
MITGKEIKMIDNLIIKGLSYPVKFAFEANNELKSIKVDKINKVNIEELEGKEVYIFSLESEIEDEKFKFDLAFEDNSKKWLITNIE